MVELPYDHAQPGWLIRWIIGGILLGLGVMAPSTTQFLWIPASIMFVVLVLFHSLRARVDRHQVQLSFGIGVISRSIDVGRIASCEVVTTPWFFGYGIRYVFDGWMWNVSGPWSVRLEYTDGTHFRIGTDRPEDLKAAIDAAIGATGSSAAAR